MTAVAPPQAPPEPTTGTRRREDTRFLCGQGEYLGDAQRPDLKHIAILRSPLAHARIRDVDVSGALTLPGVGLTNIPRVSTLHYIMSCLLYILALSRSAGTPRVA